MSHWATQYIGLPHVNGATGPEAFDCWGLVRHCQRERYDIELPHVQVLTEDLDAHVRMFRAHPEFRNWLEVSVPKDGDCVVMGRAREPAHIGMWIKANNTSGVLHACQGVGVVFQPMASLRASGWGLVRFYRHKSKVTT
jgi:cell wall-associated NlpC family hydrolase